jgi:Tol biopolymer transport system component
LNDPEADSTGASAQTGRDDRLDSWKRIAAYLKRDVSTVQRWERRESMPVHRHQHDKLGSVFAFRSELDSWWTGRRGDLSDDESSTPVADSRSVIDESRGVAQRRSIGSHRLAIGVAAAVVVALVAAAGFIVRSDLLFRSPLADAKFSTVMDVPGEAQAAAISRDGKELAFVARDKGATDVWLGTANGGRYRNLTNGTIGDLVNPATRTLGFSADSQLVFIWTRHVEGYRPNDINILAAPTSVDGPLQLYLAGAAELDSSHDGKRLVYHTTAPGDPLFIKDVGASAGTPDRRIYAATEGVHCHFPTWAADDAYIYFVRGVPPDEWDIWRVRPNGSDLEQITSQNSRIAYPVLLDQHTLLYLADDEEHSGPWIYAIDLERRVAHRISHGVENFTSLAGSTDGSHLVATVANPRTSIWRINLDSNAGIAPAAPEQLSPSGAGGRFTDHGIVYVARSARGQAIWTLDFETGMRHELWNTAEGRIVGAPAASFDRHRLAFSVEGNGRSKLYAMDTDGSNVRVVADSLVLRGDPSWAPDGQSIVIAALRDGKPNLTRIFVNGEPPIPFTSEYSIDPVWSPDGQMLVYTGGDVGTTFPLRAAAADGHPQPLPGIMLSRGARRVAFMPNSRALAILSGGIDHKTLSLIDLESGGQRALVQLPAEFEIHDFDISADGRQVVFDRTEVNSRIALIERRL